MNKKIFGYEITINKDGESYHAFVPSLPGCHSSGKTTGEIKENIREAIRGYQKVKQEKIPHFLI